MKRIYIIIIAIVASAIILGLVVGNSMRGIVTGSHGGTIGVVEIIDNINTSKFIIEDLKMFADDPSIRAIVLRVDSPGGGVAASQEIFEQVKRTSEEKMVIVSMGAVAASGGYYVSLPADVIVANPGTITGSIGVIMEFPVLQELLHKIGIEFEVIKSREYKDIGSPFRKIERAERELLGDVVDDVYEQFIDATVEERQLSRDTVYKYGDGRILSGRQAYEIGLIDTLGSFEEAMKIAGDLVGIERPQIIYPQKRMSVLDFFTEPMEHLLIPTLSYRWR